MALSIERPRQLAPDQWNVFTRMSGIVRAADIDRRYDQLSESKRGKVISVDVARFLAPEFQSWDGRLRHTPATANPAGAYAHDRLRRELVSEHRPSKRLLITAGGAGSGKTSMLGDTTDVADLVFDNQFRQHERARSILRSALHHGWRVEVVYVHRPFEDVVPAVIERSQRTGRWNGLAELPRMHIDAQRTIVRLWQEFHGRVFIHAVYNASLGKADRPLGSTVSMKELHPGGRYHLPDADALLRTIPPILDQTIKEHVVCQEVADLIGNPASGRG